MHNKGIEALFKMCYYFQSRSRKSEDIVRCIFQKCQTKTSISYEKATGDKQQNTIFCVERPCERSHIARTFEDQSRFVQDRKRSHKSQSTRQDGNPSILSPLETFKQRFESESHLRISLFIARSALLKFGKTRL